MNEITKNIIIILGTRPEAIKLAPVILELRKNCNFNVLVCNTEQQKELSNQTLNYFGIQANFNLDVMQQNQTLSGVQTRILNALSDVYLNNHFDATIVQGDTMTTFCGALSSFYNQVPVFHVEAGLRSSDLAEPFPEEALRQMISRITKLHFAPTQLAYKALLKEGVAENQISLTGNTVIDAVSCLSAETLAAAQIKLKNKNVVLSNKLVLITAHRRENHGERLDKIIEAITELTIKFIDHQFVLPVHPNPNVHDKIYTALKNIQNVILTNPLDYPELVCVMKHAKLILTDSGGIQEEAPSFGVPVLVLRYETERVEAISAGFAKLVGADSDKIFKEASAVLLHDKSQTRLDASMNPFGDGFAAQKIANTIKLFWK
ncbi:MAG: UDP-N-acetylglucosamine 2-epimerase (non-hydrolyzing) [Deltaproteobacteria bacterium]|jgi:UDP-N-acetylglucosamine 2-epimerase (non-hydrolysing)|nr:UDP-N-acetylglucosamine 2-epimerase (non-hydrolyzing) [Deltaproteobacteria bacterium]